VLAGGGTGGHIYPLLAFADACAGTSPRCGSPPRQPEGHGERADPAAGYDLRVIPAFQLPRSVNLNLLRTPDRMYKSAHAAGKVIDEVQADVVVGFGGYVSVPAYLAAWRRELPIVIHEVNVPPGVANRMA
jgi:UDP-N-acetylglucosamine--N-acetylmuramyl-(pentapeptide) pyrophosphoryl-undecaprenol N-acetylglucosamine transferase